MNQVLKPIKNNLTKILFLLFFVVISCSIKSKTKFAKTNSEELETAPPEEYFKIREGFVLATVVHEFKDCNNLLKIEDKYYQVLNLDSSLNVNKLKIWIKYTPSRISVKQCKIAIPIVVNEVYVSEKQ